MFGKYAPFIIPAYLITFGALAGLVAVTLISWRNRQKELKNLEAEADRRNGKATND